MRVKSLFIFLLSFFCYSLKAETYPFDTIVADVDNHAGGTVVVENITDMECDLRAVANSGYTFFQWSDGVTANPRHHTQQKSESVENSYWAVFTKNDDMNLSNGSLSVTIDDPNVPSFTLTAYPANGYTFYKWDNGVSTVDVSYREADGHRYPYMISNTGSLIFDYANKPGGVVSIQNVSGLNYEIVATANAGYTFLKWADGNTDNPRAYTHGGSEKIDEIAFAVFTKNSDMVSDGGNITVAIDNQTIPSYELTIHPFEGYEFYKWDNGQSATTIAYLESDGNRYPFFLTDVGTLIFEYDNHPGGTVEAQNISGLQYDLVATANSGYTFLKWADGNTQNPRPYNHGGDDKVDEVAFAVFTKNSDMTTAGGNITVAIDDKNIPSYQLTINLNEGVEFYKWDNGEANTTIDYLESDGNRYPFFKSLAGVLTFDFVQHPGGIVSVDNVEGLNLDLIATANAGYTFQQWADGNKDNPRSYTHGGNEKVDEIAYAVFTRDQDVVQESGSVIVTVDNQNIPSFELNAQNSSCAEFRAWSTGETANKISYVEADGSKVPVFDYGDYQVLYEVENEPGGHIDVTPGTCQFTYEAIPDANWHFDYWEDDDSMPATRVVAYAEGVYIAHFSRSAYMVNDVVYATFEEAKAAAGSDKPIQIIDDVQESLTISTPITIQGNGHIINSIAITETGSLALSGSLSVNNLYLFTTTGASSQLKNYQDNLTIIKDAYLDVKLEANAEKASPTKWYGFSVPFEVDVESGISRVSGPSSHVSGTDYLINRYNGNSRANTGNGWEKMLGGTLQPGLFYMIGIEGTQNIWRFKKTPSSVIGGNSTVPLTYYTGAKPAETDGGWNAVGNPTTTHANGSVSSINYCQVYDNSLSKYVVKLFANTSFVMSCPFFIQVGSTGKSLVMVDNSSNPHPLYAQQRYTDSNALCYQITLSDGVTDDDLFLTSSEDAQPIYEVGKDLVKLMGGLNTHYIWSNSYGYMLCAEDAPYQSYSPIEYSVNIYAPKAGMYTIKAQGDNNNIYLIQDGITLTELHNDYTISLPRGLSNFTIRIGEKVTTTTGCENVNDNMEITKFVRDGVMYIRKGNQVYDAQGQMIERK